MLLKSERRLLGIGVAIVVALGLALGFGVGLLTRPTVPVDATVERAGVDFDDRQADAPGLPGWEDVYVNDYARLLEPETEQTIRADLIELYDHTGIEMTVLTIPRAPLTVFPVATRPSPRRCSTSGASAAPRRTTAC